ncbi:hypothetical protein ACFCP7_15525 [Paenibacillus elgii]
MQTVTVQIRIFPNDVSLLKEMGDEYIKTVNLLTEQAEASGTFPKLTSKRTCIEGPPSSSKTSEEPSGSLHCFPEITNFIDYKKFSLCNKYCTR